ncbi:MAG: TetR/AcrR family transcriptional regulator [bacterium]|nr:TetR/AcrR family transcriptional regulator [bacterium]
MTTSVSDPASGGDRRTLQRGRILEAARGVFFRDGFMNANLDEVAQIAGVAKGTLYRYFENKGDLYVALLADGGAIFQERLGEAARTPGSAADQIRELGRFYVDHWTRNRENFWIFWALDNQEVIGDLPDALVQEITRLWHSCLKILAAAIDRGVESGEFAPCDSWEVANILWTMANGVIQTELAAPRRRLRDRPLDQVFRDMVEIFLRGMRSAP